MARRGKHDLFKWRDDNAGYYENFTVRGRRFRRSLNTDRRDEAEARAAQNYAAALAGQTEAAALPASTATPAAQPTAVFPSDQTLSHVLGQYWLEHGQFLPSASDIQRMGRELMAGLGKDKRAADLTVSDLTRYAARRRATLANRSVNIELEHLRAVLARARDQGVPAPTFKWSKILLEEEGPREHILSEDEEARLFAALRPDYHAMIRFALLTGMRLDNVVSLTWRQIDRQAGVITLRVKSKKPGGELHYVPITPAIGAILDQERGNHFQRVFTYVCERNRHDPRRNVRQDKGARYPYTHDGWRKAWSCALTAAAIEDFRFHDLRHTAGTRTLRAVGNLQIVQKQLGHKDIRTTLRYTKSDLGDVRTAMEQAQASMDGRSKIRR
jgi:integrase